jgi:hypothetical protein
MMSSSNEMRRHHTVDNPTNNQIPVRPLELRSEDSSSRPISTQYVYPPPTSQRKPLSSRPRRRLSLSTLPPVTTDPVNKAKKRSWVRSATRKLGFGKSTPKTRLPQPQPRPRGLNSSYQVSFDGSPPLPIPQHLVSFGML